ncbi:MAG TPA: glycosyltransferase [Kineosporiaceae bacterium]|nr:glycosyltransferase [Kineosporiaceae bacterium]
MPAGSVADGRPDVSVVTSGHDVADARLHREVAALLRAGLTVEVLGLGDPGGGPDGATVRTRPRGSMRARALRAVRLPFAARGRVLITLDPDVVPSALLTALLRRRRLVADVHEDYVALLVDRGWVPGPLLGLLRRLTGWCVGLAGSAALTVVADVQVPPDRDRCRRRLVVRNLPDASLLPPPAVVPPDPLPRAVYVGDVRTTRGLRTMVEAIAAAPGWQLDVVGPVAAADQGWLDERLARADVAGRVHLHGRLPPRASWQVAGRASVGMMLMSRTPAFWDAVPTKLYEYLAMGLAVLSTEMPRVEAMTAGSQACVLVPDAALAAEVLRGWSAAPADLAKARLAALAWADRELRGPSEYDVLAAEVLTLLRP